MWPIQTTDLFDTWFNSLCDTDRANVLASMIVLSKRGPTLCRPYADTVKGSAYSNMKELRIQSHGSPIRVFFAFSPARIAVLFCGGHKTVNEKRFYRMMISIADREFEKHVNQSGKR